MQGVFLAYIFSLLLIFLVISIQYKTPIFDDIKDYVLWKCKMNALLFQQDVHGAINADDLSKKTTKNDKKKI